MVLGNGLHLQVGVNSSLGSDKPGVTQVGGALAGGALHVAGLLSIGNDHRMQKQERPD